MNKIQVIGPKDRGYTDYINTTTSSKTWSRGLSPMLIGPVELWGGHVALNVENAWQFCKRFPQHVTYEDWLAWAKKGWADSWAHRYPMGKGAVPLYSYWDGEKLNYVEARKRIYVPLYAEAVRKTDAYKRLEALYRVQDVVLWDYDGYSDYTSLEEVLNDPKRRMGHAFCLAMMLEGKI